MIQGFALQLQGLPTSTSEASSSQLLHHMTGVTSSALTEAPSTAVTEAGEVSMLAQSSSSSVQMMPPSSLAPYMVIIALFSFFWKLLFKKSKKGLKCSIKVRFLCVKSAAILLFITRNEGFPHLKLKIKGTNLKYTSNGTLRYNVYRGKYKLLTLKLF